MNFGLDTVFNVILRLEPVLHDIFRLDTVFNDISWLGAFRVCFKHLKLPGFMKSNKMAKNNVFFLDTEPPVHFPKPPMTQKTLKMIKNRNLIKSAKQRFFLDTEPTVHVTKPPITKK